MPIRYSRVSGGSSGFCIEVDGSSTSFQLDKALPAGGYEIVTSTGQAVYDIYALTEDNTLIGYTNGLVLNATANFSKLSILGVEQETFTFTYKGEVAASVQSGLLDSSGAYITSISPSSVPSMDDTFAVSGGNFSNNVQVVLVGQDGTEYTSKSVILSSPTALLAIRPDTLPVAKGPYSVKVYNPGVPQPTDSNAHILENSMSPGTLPVWITGNIVYWNFGTSTTTQISLSAQDVENLDVDYSIASGSLFDGLTLNNETGVVSGVISGSVTGGSYSDITFRATDSGGNYVDKVIRMYANNGPQFTTPSGQITIVDPGGTVNNSVVASSDISPNTITYSIQTGSLPGGISMNTSGAISGTYNGTAGTSSFIVRATDQQGLYADRTFSIGVPFFREILSTSSWTVPASVTSLTAVVAAGGGGGGGGVNGGGGGGGAGGIIVQSGIAVVPGESLSIAIGAGGAGGTNNGNHGAQGGSTTFSGSSFSISTTGGGYGTGQAQVNGGDGGSGGGTTGYTNYGQQPGSGITGQGNAGGPNTYGTYATGGGGKGSVGGANANAQSGSGGSGINVTAYAGYLKTIGGGGGGGGGYSAYGNLPGPGGSGGGATGAYASNAINATANTGSGGGGGGYNNYYGSNGGSGIVIIKYYG